MSLCRKCGHPLEEEDLSNICETCYHEEQQPTIEMIEEQAIQDYRAAHGYYDDDLEPTQ